MRIYIFKRRMYRVIVSVDDDVDLDLDLDIQLTAEGKRYARERAHGFHRRVDTDEGALLAEILAARDDWQPVRPDRDFERRRFENA